MSSFIIIISSSSSILVPNLKTLLDWVLKDPHQAKVPHPLAAHVKGRAWVESKPVRRWSVDSGVGRANLSGARASRPLLGPLCLQSWG